MAKLVLNPITGSLDVVEPTRATVQDAAPTTAKGKMWLDTDEAVPDIYLRNDGDMGVGVYNFGDGSSNYSQFESDGTLHFNGNATVWDDIRIPPGSFDRPGIADPTMVAYQPAGTGLSTYVYQFAKDQLASFAVQIPHNYKVGSDIYLHIHWTPGPNGATENGNTVGWKIDYTWAGISDTFGAIATVDCSDACDGTDHKHQMTPDVQISGTGKGISSMLMCNIKRTDTGTDDTWAGTASGALPILLEVDFHYQIDTVGSRERTTK